MGATASALFRRPFVPEAFGKYYLLDRIAVGGMAEVFRAKTFGHSGFEKVLVIKKILDRFAEDPDFVEMFIDEAKLSVQLAHPNIAQIYDFGKIDTNYFIAMEAVEGKDCKSVLRRLAERGEHMPVETACYLGHQIARGLDYAHKKSDSMGLPLNIVHRDVSPSNVLVSYEGHVKIVDFGIAHADDAGRESESGVLKGKYSYMSPEQASGLELDNRSDIFSAGICLWEMLTGNRLFRHATELETLEAIKICQVPLPSSYRPEVPPELDEICLIALARAPGDRFQDAGEMQVALGDFLLPKTADRIAPGVATFMHELFGEEIRQERERLDRGTTLASELHFGAEVDLDLDEEGEEEGLLAVSTETVRPVAAPTSATSKIVLAALGIVGALMVTLLVLLWPLLFPPMETSTLQVSVGPPDIEGVTMTLDGELTESTHLQVVPDVPHEIVISAPGYTSRTKTIELVPGQVYSLEVDLQSEALPDLPPESLDFEEPITEPVEVATPRLEPRTPRPVVEAPPDLPAVETPTAVVADAEVYFVSKPPGATVFVNGRKVGTAPLSWPAEPGVTYNVEYRSPDRQSVQAVVTAPAAGGTTSLNRELPALLAPKPGLLSVQATPGWAKIYLDGAYVSTTPLIKHELEPGSYEIRLVNDRLGADISDTLTIRAGETTIKSYQLDR